MTPQAKKFLAKKVKRIMCDGSFKFAPKSVKQVYRIFGVAKGGFSCPLVTALVNGMSEQLYTEMWMAGNFLSVIITKF
jgi:hypothetical protein